MKLSILIPSLQRRNELLRELINEIAKQKMDYNVEVKILIDNGEEKIGAKRNKLLESATGDYICFIDDDDKISAKYISKIFEGIKKGVDCCSIRGVITWDGENPELFEHSIKYDAYKTNDTGMIKYERYPNHLNCIKANIAKRFKFPETDHGEDTDWATQIYKIGLIKTEHVIDDIIYHYKYITKK